MTPDYLLFEIYYPSSSSWSARGYMAGSQFVNNTTYLSYTIEDCTLIEGTFDYRVIPYYFSTGYATPSATISLTYTP